MKARTMVRIAGWGHAVPPEVISSSSLEEQLQLEAGWMIRRTGIESRRYAGIEQATSDLAIEAVQAAVAKSSPFVKPGLLILATSTPDHLLPPTSPLVAHRCGLVGWGAIDLAGACGGFLYALALGHAHCHVQGCPVVIVAANVLSRRIDPSDAGTRALFADSAAAILLLPSPDPDDCLMSIDLGANGSHYDCVKVPSGGSRKPHTPSSLEKGEQYMRMARGPELFRIAIEAMVGSGQHALRSAGLTPSDIDWWIPHQANTRLIHEAGKRLHFPVERTLSIVETWGNSSSATIPLALSLAANDGRIREGQTLLLTAVGAGLVHAAAVVKWNSGS